MIIFTRNEIKDMLEIPENVLNIIKNITNDKGVLVPARIHMHMNDECENFLKKNSLTLKELNYIVQNNLDDIPSCPICGNRIKNFVRNCTYCSPKCAQSDKAVQEKKIRTNIERYGVKQASMLSSVQEKQKQTNLKKYGCEYSGQAEEVKAKTRQTNLEKYGCACSLCNSEINQKRIETWKIKYSTDNPLKSDAVRAKIQKTMHDRYGNSSFGGSHQHKSAMRDIFRKKVASGEFYNELMRSLRTKRKNFFEKCSEKLNDKKIEILSSKEEFSEGIFPLKFRCTRCGTEFHADTTNPQKIYCRKCFSERTSNGEREIAEFIRSIYHGNIIEHDRAVLNGKELDIFIPEKHVAIEYDGLYWHSELFVDKNYHIDKTEACISNGIRLIHVFESEWIEKQNIIKSIIASSLGIYEKKIYARKCSVEHITAEEYAAFLDDNHVQGRIASSVRYGLFCGSDLVAVIGFGKSRFRKGEIELHRFCTKINTQIIGGFSKLIEHSGIQSFISYIDRAKFTGDGYLKSGFEIAGRSGPSYFYVRNFHVLSRYECQKHRLKMILDNYDEKLSEHENMNNNHYYRVYDCGTIKVIKRNDDNP